MTTIWTRLPYAAGEYSKNKMNMVAKIGGRTAIIKSPAARAKLVEIELAVIDSADAAQAVFVSARVDVIIKVYKDNLQSDAINVVDLVCDGIKRGIGVDDAWFSVAVVWGVDRKDPRIIIKITQRDVEDHWYCLRCDAYRPISMLDSKKRCKGGCS